MQWYAPWEGVRGLTIVAPGIGRPEPGQYLLCAARKPVPQVLPRVCLPTGDAGDGSFDCLLADGDEARLWCALKGEADTLAVTGPLGKPYTLDPSTRRALLVDGGLVEAPLLSLVQKLTRQGVEIAYLACAPPGRTAVPARALPPETEYLPVQPGQGGTDGLEQVIASLERLVLWPDAIYIAADREYLAPIHAVLRRRLLRLRKGFAQVLILPPTLPCGVGACDLCGLETRQGRRRPCRDGLVFDLLALP